MYDHRSPYPNELTHYGVIGMKWGVRRYQNADGTLTEAGKQQYSRKEVRADNKVAFEKGKAATVYSRAADIAEKGVRRATERSDKHPESARLLKKQEIAENTAIRLREEADKALKDAEDHVKQLKEKYGEEHVSDLNYDKNGRINERVISGKDWLYSAGVSAGFSSFGLVALPALGGPAFALVSMPKTAQEQARDVYNMTYQSERRDYNKR